MYIYTKKIVLFTLKQGSLKLFYIQQKQRPLKNSFVYLSEKGLANSC